MRIVTLLLFMLTLAFPAYAVQPNEVLPDAAMENRARDISTGLRCLVCQNESIDDSDAPLARDLRILVRDRLKAGDSDADVKAFIVERYGEFVLLKPVFGLHTAILWLGPIVILMLGAFAVFCSYARRESSEPSSLRPDEQARIETLLKEE